VAGLFSLSNPDLLPASLTPSFGVLLNSPDLLLSDKNAWPLEQNAREMRVHGAPHLRFSCALRGALRHAPYENTCKNIQKTLASL
jgi:hypothetical protein